MTLPSTAEPVERTSEIALIGTPNCGKTTLFNALTGLRHKVANYPGVTVEKKEGAVSGAKTPLMLLDLPGIYSLAAQTPDEVVTRDILEGEGHYATRPSAILAVIDGSALDRSLSLLASLFTLGLPTAVVVTMSDEIKRRGGRLDIIALRKELGVPVAAVVGHRGVGLDQARSLLEGWQRWPVPPLIEGASEPAGRYAWAERVMARALSGRLAPDALTRRIDRVVLHPVAGPLVFLAVIALFFQAIFSGAKPLMDGLGACFDWLGLAAAPHLPEALRGFVVDGLIAGTGSVVVFLPQIMILFFLIHLLEDIGYMARAAFLMDRVMGWAGLQGRCFISLLSSYACAVPGIMAARTIPSPQDRLATILTAPFITCSARLPVYALLIGAFIPDRPVFGPLRLQGLTLLILYIVGSLSSFLAAWLLRSSILRGDMTPFYMELPPYRFPALKSVLVSMGDRAWLFLRRVGVIILPASLMLWVLLSFPRTPAPAGATPTQAASLSLENSFAGRAGKAMETVLRPLGYDWRIGVALLASLAAREVVVSVMAQIYRVESADSPASLQAVLAHGKDPRTGKPFMTTAVALSLLAFFVYALQCISTLAVIRRETGLWRWTVFAFSYMLVCAYAAAFITYHAALALGIA